MINHMLLIACQYLSLLIHECNQIYNYHDSDDDKNCDKCSVKIERGMPNLVPHDAHPLSSNLMEDSWNESFIFITIDDPTYN